MPFIEGLLIGIGMVVFIGPVLFTLLKASLDHGFTGGFFVALGIIVSDVAALFLCAAGAIPFFENESNQFWIAILGGTILVVLGTKYIISPMLYQQEGYKLKKKDKAGLFSRGFLVNFVNPFVFIVWIGLIVHAESKFTSNREVWIFLGAVLIGIFSTDTLKAFFAQKLQKFLKPKTLKKIYLVLGLLMIAFSIRVFIYSAQL